MPSVKAKPFAICTPNTWRWAASMNPWPRHGWVRATRPKLRPSWSVTPKLAGAIRNRSSSCPNFLFSSLLLKKFGQLLERLRIAPANFGVTLQLGRSFGLVALTQPCLGQGFIDAAPLHVFGVHIANGFAFTDGIVPLLVLHESCNGADALAPLIETLDGFLGLRFQPGQELLIELLRLHLELFLDYLGRRHLVGEVMQHGYQLVIAPLRRDEVADLTALEIRHNHLIAVRRVHKAAVQIRNRQ